MSDMATGDINNITSRFSKEVYITQEVIYGAGEPITPAQYTQNGQFNPSSYRLTLTECEPQVTLKSASEFQYRWVGSHLQFRFRYPSALKSAFSSGGISGLQDLESQGTLPYLYLWFSLI